jgi:pimeloyl-ACP methyl ester carboxylesterase
MRAPAFGTGECSTGAEGPGWAGAWARALAGLTLGLVLAACTTPALDFDRAADELGLELRQVTGTRFEHVVYAKGGSPTRTLHVYLDGDGTPWFAGRPAADPTPRDPLVLRLMAMDPAPAVYLGRPCYHGVDDDRDCAPRLWTSDRYSEDVVESLAAVLRRLLADGGYRKIAWFGHSGGGTLATLLAPRFPESEAVVTVAANLDTDAWAAFSWGGDLAGSVNPAKGQPLPAAIRQRHYAGGADRIVPASLTAQGASRVGGDLVVVEGYDHTCCWEQAWPHILDDLLDDRVD